MIHKILLVASLLFVTGCASSQNNGGALPTPPRSVQYTIELDWQYSLNPNPPKALGNTPLDLGNAVSVRGTTYAGSSNGKVVAIDESTAQKKWIRNFDIPVTAGPIVAPKAVFIALSDGSVHKLNPLDGSTIWSFETGAAIENGLSVNGDVVACINSNNRLYVLDEKTGEQKWRRERPRSQEFVMYGQATPYFDENGNIFAGFSDGYLVAYASNGTAIWSRELAPEARFKDLDTQPIRIGDTLYVASSSGGLFALSADDGHTLWQRPIYGISGIKAFQDSIYISSQSGIFRIRRSDGSTIWQNVILKNALISNIQLGKTYLYASVQRLGLVILNRKSGDLIHTIDTGSDFTSPPYLTSGALTALSNNASVYRFIIDDEPIK